MSSRHISDAQSDNTSICRGTTRRRLWQVRGGDLKAANVVQPLSTNSSISVRSAAAAAAAEQGITASRTCCTLLCNSYTYTRHGVLLVK